MTKTKSSKQAVTPIAETPQLPISVLIIGAGFAGLGAAIRLLEAGVKDIVILERSIEVGGTWRDNSYPGAACDIPSNLYSYSFAQNPAWSRGFSGSKEILSYIHYLVERFQLARFIRFNHTVTDLIFDEAQGIWQVATIDGQTWRARTVVMAQGPLSNASFPKIDGIDSFKGKKIHSAQWDHSYDFNGKRVAVIGTGASAIQIIPELVKVVATLKVFQRTASWVMPRPDYATPDWSKALFTKIPATQNALRHALYLMHESMALGVVWNSPLTALFEGLGRRYLRHQVKDSWLRRQLMPDYRLGCKRILVSNDYYPELQQKNCQLITWPIAKIAPDGIRTAEGLEHQVDCIVFATGFEIAKSGAPFPITGLKGRQLNDEWSRGAKAYKSVSVAGYPNLFLTFGPNSGPGHNSALVYMESQIDYLVKGIQTVLQAQVKFIDVRADVQASYNTHIQKRLTKTNWNTGCKSWYLTDDGYNSTMYPGFATQFKRQMQTFEPNDYQVVAV